MDFVLLLVTFFFFFPTISQSPLSTKNFLSKQITIEIHRLWIFTRLCASLTNLEARTRFFFLRPKLWRYIIKDSFVLTRQRQYENKFLIRNYSTFGTAKMFHFFFIAWSCLARYFHTIEQNFVEKILSLFLPDIFWFFVCFSDAFFVIYSLCLVSSDEPHILRPCVSSTWSIDRRYLRIDFLPPPPLDRSCHSPSALFSPLPKFLNLCPSHVCSSAGANVSWSFLRFLAGKVISIRVICIFFFIESFDDAFLTRNREKGSIHFQLPRFFVVLFVKHRKRLWKGISQFLLKSFHFLCPNLVIRFARLCEEFDEMKMTPIVIQIITAFGIFYSWSRTGVEKNSTIQDKVGMSIARAVEKKSTKKTRK